MAHVRRKTVVASRRRREDDGEEEGSVVEDIEDDSLSEGSAISNGEDDADIEGSDMSEELVEQLPGNRHTQGVESIQAVGSPSRKTKQAVPAGNDTFKATADTEAMLNGLKTFNEEHGRIEIKFDSPDAETARDPQVHMDQQNRKGLAKETIAERGRREHQQYVKQRNENPTFVPNRGGFFLHDNRSAGSGVSGSRPPMRGRGRASYNGGESGRGVSITQPKDQQWAHDLHDSVLNTKAALSLPSTNQPHVARPAKAPAATPYAQQTSFNRSFSISTLVGNVSVTIHLPGMAKKVSVSNVVKKQHTLLPQHRPPLRRDKPVRIFLADQLPRYIFPSVERSFIFIPRALRPNQQSFGRARGRGSFHGSRRTSVYGASTYTPSIAMSRRSSVGGPTTREAVSSPTGSMPSRQAAFICDPSKPVVRLPPNARMVVPIPASLQALPSFGRPPVAISVPEMSAPQRDLAAQENRTSSITMHQPRPQKTVSVADIESPATFTFNPPRQQQEQPFHQQVPPQVSGQVYVEDPLLFKPHSRHPSHPSQPSGSPLSQIPERAVYAQPFQPFPLPHPQGYFAAPYAPGTLFYPAMAGDVSPYSGAMAPAVMAPAFVPGSHPAPFIVAPPPPASAADAIASPGTVAHESNGMVYYYDASQLPQAPQSTFSPSYPAAPNGGVVGMGAMMTPPGPYYYPHGPAGVYYGPQ